MISFLQRMADLTALARSLKSRGIQMADEPKQIDDGGPAKEKWWLISDEARQIVEQALMASTHEANSYNCQDWPPGEGCSGCDGDELREKARHELACGLHVTDAIPADYEDKR